MWRTLSDDARQAVRDLCDKHGARLYDYCRTELAADDAEQAVAGAALTAHLYADRVVDPALRRPWLYAVARAHRAIVAAPASIGSWSRPGRMSELLPEALLSLERPQRELLDLSLRHGLADTELCVIFELRRDEVRDVIARATASLEEWFAAIVAARGADGCPDLTARVSEWVASPGRRARARIGRHIQSCATCRAAPRTVSAAALLRSLPITTLPGTLPDRLASARPLPGEGPLWRADGFPVQARTLVETGPSPAPPVADATPQDQVAGPTTATSGKPWSAAGAAAADQERPAAPAVRGRHPFTPPSRTRAFRGGSAGDKLVYSTAISGSGNGHHDEGAIIRYGGINLGADLVELRDGQVREFWKDRPDDDDPEAGPPIRAVARLGLVVGVGLLVAGLVWAVMNAQQQQPATLTKTAAAETGVLEQPPPSAGDAPGRQAPPSTGDARGQEAPAGAAAVTGGGLASTVRKADLPEPAPPVARLSPASVSLGSGRTGTISLSCTGKCEITSATGTNGITVSGTAFTVRAPLSRCAARPSVERGRITVRWSGRTAGDGKTTGGTSAGHGTLTMKVSWTVAAKDGVRVLDRDRGVVTCL
ncbi:hypothetical protein FH608_046860 [Nonomuraea phyllanthi]|uniref:Uncharacterized protein n=1 Tax=Nonomuraea phyllanthi TaxID=2219224 RepID=A0A5C4V5B7_9ACTN|nr:hypothetical protein [Nonomuraea phyllanthi]KAB8186249.1 hypothetical protein FH608_046860 [Nonomuraea phyllanthi]QFY11577.1 hypothetical protein GBF35_37840 [Nonomuraea phyllanthi]